MTPNFWSETEILFSKLSYAVFIDFKATIHFSSLVSFNSSFILSPTDCKSFPKISKINASFDIVSPPCAI